MSTYRMKTLRDNHNEIEKIEMFFIFDRVDKAENILKI